jgi:thymidylate synthase
MAFTVWFQKHIYENQLDMLQQQLAREPYESPHLSIDARVPDYAKTGVYEPEWLEKIEPADFSLTGYRHHEPLSAPMAV